MKGQFRGHSAAVIVCNLPGNVTHTAVRMLFSEFGAVVSCCLKTSRQQTTAIVELHSQEGANQAVLVLNGTQVEDQVLTAALYPVTTYRQAADLVFLQYLPALYTFTDIQQLIQTQGIVQQYFWVSSDYISNTQNALVRMESAEQAQAVVKTLDCVFFIGCSRNLSAMLVNKFVREDYEFENMNVRNETLFDFDVGVNWKINFENSTDMMLSLKPGSINKIATAQLQTSDSQPDTFGVCVKNIPGSNFRHQYAFLVANFVKYGSIHRIKVLRYPNGRSFGYGFVDFYDACAAKKALEELNGATFGSKTLKVSYSDKTIPIIL
eukprot:TRINITY_DN91865_c0_g1_i1.p2 TRINITY_DN91865_c0_g1~~TRINITY_DN91865_c0_g1_i1.p2  ORF type:complete len:322 (-),score=38.97 TRINITY_DN91865_c0_g1_i1:346-1311(-)